MKNGDVPRARACYETAITELGDDGMTEVLLISFAEFEELVKEYDRSRAIYKYALDTMPKHAAGKIYSRFV